MILQSMQFSYAEILQRICGVLWGHDPDGDNNNASEGISSLQAMCVDHVQVHSLLPTTLNPVNKPSAEAPSCTPGGLQSITLVCRPSSIRSERGTVDDRRSIRAEIRHKAGNLFDLDHDEVFTRDC